MALALLMVDGGLAIVIGCLFPFTIGMSFLLIPILLPLPLVSLGCALNAKRIDPSGQNRGVVMISAVVLAGVFIASLGVATVLGLSINKNPTRGSSSPTSTGSSASDEGAAPKLP